MYVPPLGPVKQVGVLPEGGFAVWDDFLGGALWQW